MPDIQPRDAICGNLRLDAVLPAETPVHNGTTSQRPSLRVQIAERAADLVYRVASKVQPGTPRVNPAVRRSLASTSESMQVILAKLSAGPAKPEDEAKFLAADADEIVKASAPIIHAGVRFDDLVAARLKVALAGRSSEEIAILHATIQSLLPTQGGQNVDLLLRAIASATSGAAHLYGAVTAAPFRKEQPAHGETDITKAIQKAASASKMEPTGSLQVSDAIKQISNAELFWLRRNLPATVDTRTQDEVATEFHRRAALAKNGMTDDDLAKTLARHLSELAAGTKTASDESHKNAMSAIEFQCELSHLEKKELSDSLSEEAKFEIHNALASVSEQLCRGLKGGAATYDTALLRLGPAFNRFCDAFTPSPIKELNNLMVSSIKAMDSGEIVELCESHHAWGLRGGSLAGSKVNPLFESIRKVAPLLASVRSDLAALQSLAVNNPGTLALQLLNDLEKLKNLDHFASEATSSRASLIEYISEFVRSSIRVNALDSENLINFTKTLDRLELPRSEELGGVLDRHFAEVNQSCRRKFAEVADSVIHKNLTDVVLDLDSLERSTRLLEELDRLRGAAGSNIPQQDRINEWAIRVLADSSDEERRALNLGLGRKDITALETVVAEAIATSQNDSPSRQNGLANRLAAFGEYVRTFKEAAGLPSGARSVDANHMFAARTALKAALQIRIMDRRALDAAKLAEVTQRCLDEMRTRANRVVGQGITDQFARDVNRQTVKFVSAGKSSVLFADAKVAATSEDLNNASTRNAIVQGHMLPLLGNDAARLWRLSAFMNQESSGDLFSHLAMSENSPLYGLQFNGDARVEYEVTPGQDSDKLKITVSKIPREDGSFELNSPDGSQALSKNSFYRHSIEFTIAHDGTFTKQTEGTPTVEFRIVPQQNASI